MYSILDYGAVGDGKTLCTRNIQAAIDACPVEGGTIYIPSGKYLCGTVYLHDNIQVIFEMGAVLLGSKNTRDDFTPDEFRDEPLYQDASHSYYNHSLFVARRCENITFSGFGTIDMQSAWEMDERDFGLSLIDRKRGAKIFTFVECKNIVIKDLKLRNATDLTVYLLGCERVKIHSLDIKAHIDGISPDCCKDVIISDCIVETGDDGIAIKSSYSLSRFQICENVAISNCIVSSRCSAIKLGTESNAGYRNIVVSNCIIENTRLSGIALEIADGGTMENIGVCNITMKNVGTPIFIVLCNRGRGPKGTDIGYIKNIQLSNITATGPYEEWEACVHDFYHPETSQIPQVYSSSITGLKNRKIENILLSNIYLEVPGGETSCMDNFKVPYNEKAYPENVMYGKLPAYGIYIRDCDSLKMNNVVIKTLKEDKRRAIIAEDVTEIYIDGVSKTSL